MKFKKVAKFTEEYLTEDLQLYKGVFWIVDLENIYNNRNYCFTIPCDTYGNNLNPSLELNAKSGTTYNHEKLWKLLPSKVTHNKPFNYYPRGRVEVANNKATIYLNPNINTEEVQKFIKNEFNLSEHNGIKKIIFHSDGSSHYNCYLDA